jgi:hypothetical protein
LAQSDAGLLEKAISWIKGGDMLLLFFVPLSGMISVTIDSTSSSQEDKSNNLSIRLFLKGMAKERSQFVMGRVV